MFCIEGVFLLMNLNKLVNALFKDLSMCTFQFKRVSKCKPEANNTSAFYPVLSRNKKDFIVRSINQTLP